MLKDEPCVKLHELGPSGGVMQRQASLAAASGPGAILPKPEATEELAARRAG